MGTPFSFSPLHRSLISSCFPVPAEASAVASREQLFLRSAENQHFAPAILL
jgi:hypothetical protein